MKLTIGFYTEGLPFNGNTLFEKALGGSETALTYMAREFARLGHRVAVFCKCDKPGEYNGVRYHDIAEIHQWRRMYDFDIFIVSRFAGALQLPVRAGLRVLWNHDILTPESKAAILGPCLWADIVLCLSDYHKAQWLSVAPEIAPILETTTNGVDLDYLDAAISQTKKKPHQFIYCSRPERGLLVLLRDIWPRIRKEMPDAILGVCGYDITGMEVIPQLKEFYAHVEQLTKTTPGVEVLGALNKKQLYRRIAEAKLILYPTAFSEISCLTALEGAAAGTPILTTAAFALTETVGDKRLLIPGHNESPDYQKAYLERFFEIMGDDTLYADLQAAGRKHVEQTYQWSKVAEDWERRFIGYMRERTQKRAEGVSRELVRIGDLAGAFEHMPTEDMCERVNIARKPESEDPIFDPNPQWAENDLRCRVVRDTVKTWLEKNGGPAGKRLLDIGSNNGAVTAFLSNEFPGLSILGYDENPEAVQVARAHADKQAKTPDAIKFIPNGLDATCADDPYDILFGGEIIEHIEDTSEFLEKCRSIVKPGGLIVLSFPNGTRQALWSGDPSPDDPKARKPAHPAHFHYFDYGDIADIFGKQRDLQIVRIAPEKNAAGEEFGNSIVCFLRSAQPFGKRDLERRRLTTRPYQSISLCMIAKNEEDNLSRCLRALYRTCDQIRIHDTGSTDETLRIARKFTDEITEHPFQDFGDSRNRSLEDATGDWILWVDADEVVLFAENMRRYLSTRLFNGLVIAQNHLMIDVPGTRDLPVRLFRNGKGYRFTGLLHEHAEDVNLGPFDNAISPAIGVGDVHIAHTGYLCEAIRRDKCRRNYPLLLADLRDNPDRQLNKVLDARDCLNFVGWEYEASHGQITAKIVELCRRAIAIHRQHFADPAHKYYPISDGQYQKALSILGRAGAPGAPDEPVPPIELELGIGVAIGGITPGQEIKNDRRWFLNRREVMEHLARKAVQTEKAIPA